MSMDYQISLQNYITELFAQLKDAQTLNHTQMVTKLQNITNSGCQPYVIQTIRSCIQHYQKDRVIMKYAYIVDKLLKLPGWNQVMQNVIVQFFCDIFIFLLIQKCFNQLDELKIIRKFWLKTIHPRHFQAMKDIILKETGIDIDQNFKAEAIELLKNHYEKKLRLTSEEMSFHLPKTLKMSNSIYQSRFNKPQKQSFIDNANYFISHPTNMPPYVLTSPVNINDFRVSPQPMITNPNQPYRNPYAPIQPNQYYPNTTAFMQSDPFRTKVNFKSKRQANIPQRISPPIDPRDPRMNTQKVYVQPANMVAQRQNIPFYPERNEIANEGYKRERLYSEETRTPNSSEYTGNQIQYPKLNYSKNQYETYEMVPPQKKVHYNEDYTSLGQVQSNLQKDQQRPKYMQILQMLQADKLYKCKQCGKGYKSQIQYEKHTTQHFDEKLLLREKKKQVQKLLNLDEWTQRGSGSSLQQFEQFYITVSNLSSELNKSNLFYNIQDFQPLQLTCKLCNQTFDLKFRLDQWTLSNATYCDIDGKTVPMHKTCQQALQESSSDELF